MCLKIFYSEVIKRICDFLLALFMLIVLFPVLVICALAIKIESKGPVFFRQDRVGKNQKLFSIYKFRSMVDGAVNEGPAYTTQNDCRITKVGAMLRKTSLDEIPQIFNVLNGTMSFIGPRPDLEKLMFKDDPKYMKRFNVRAGITGLAQASGRSLITPEKRTLLDEEYVDNISLLMDIKIIFLTIKTVLVSSDAN